MTNQEVLDVLRTAGLDIKSVSSTVDDSDLDARLRAQDQP